MGNNQNRPPLEIQITLDKESFSVDEQITGNLKVKGASDYDFEIKIQGFEEGMYKEPQSWFHKYTVKKNKFYTQISNRDNLSTQFEFNKISQPSLEMICQQFQCKIYYEIQATVFVRDSKTQQTSEPIIVNIYKPYNKMPQQIENAYNQKKEYYISGKEGVFIYDMKRINISAALDQSTYSSHEPILLNCSVRNLWKINIQINAYLCAEFYLQDRLVAAMPKLHLSDPYRINEEEQLEFKIYQNLTIPPITLGQKIGCRHFVILQILFPQNKKMNCDILLPLEIFQNRENNEQIIQIQRERNSQILSPENNEQKLLENHPARIQTQNQEWRKVYPMLEVEKLNIKNMRIAQTNQFIQIPH